jgi:excinuclease ABC subunit C
MLKIYSFRPAIRKMEQAAHPFLKLTTDEKFPRLLITRRPENKLPGQKIYGAFLPVGMARRMLDLLARTFRLHPCELDINGDFDAPCPEYFLHRCLAPCVKEICDRPTYLESVELVHLILSNQGELALKKMDEKIEKYSALLEFERAAEWRDKRMTIAEIVTNAKWQMDVSTMTDVIVLSRGEYLAQIHLTTLRRGKSVGWLNFQLKQIGEIDDKIIADFIAEFYKYYAPRQIFVPLDFPARKLLEDKLSTNFKRKIKIVAQPPDKLPLSVAKTLTLSPRVFKYKKGQSMPGKSRLLEEIKLIFGLQTLPRRIECFDVAHLAGEEIVAARVRAVDGFLQAEDGLVWEFNNLPEAVALAQAVRERIRLLHDREDTPDLLIVDGAKPQINAVKQVLKEFDLSDLPVAGAVKPLREHNKISHFLIEGTERIEFNQRSKAMSFLQNLRDASHALANETHRTLHSHVQIFANNIHTPQVKYLLVPTRYVERGGEAEDLSPIRSLTQEGEIILKTKKKRPPLK